MFADLRTLFDLLHFNGVLAKPIVSVCDGQVAISTTLVLVRSWIDACGEWW